MDRLTEPNHTYNNCEFMESGMAPFMNRLAAYEDAEADGRLIVLPCKVGDTVWTINEKYFDCENCQYKEEAYYHHSINNVACDKNDRHCPLRLTERIVEGFEIEQAKDGTVQIRGPGEWGYEGLETFYGFDGRVYFTREEAEAALEEEQT